MTNTIVALTNEIHGAITTVVTFYPVYPIHEWTIEVGDMTFGLSQVRDSECRLFFGSDWLTLPFSAPIVASGFLLLVLLLLLIAWHFIGRLRDRDAPGDA